MEATAQLMDNQEGASRSEHTPVLTQEVVQYLTTGRGGTLVDGTVGLGGHAEALLLADPDVRVVGIDRDPHALERARARLRCFGERVSLVHGNYADIGEHLARLGLGSVDGMLLDLGVSSMQLDDPERGFSLRADGPLDMRMDPTCGPTAAEWLATTSVDDIARAIGQYGEERYARRIARAIEAARGRSPIQTTSQLVEVVHRAVPGIYFAQRIDPATRTFQALRIAVNGELASLEQGLREGFRVLALGGAFVAISFHSLEDRIVKTFFRERAASCVCPPDFPECRCGKKVEAEILTRKPIVPPDLEIQQNPRARSAKLRVGRRIA
jgi:16S rRNA (cytosine1402-N4)-methyltransferase